MDDAVRIAKCDKAWEELYITSLLMRKAWEIEAASLGLTLPQALVLHCLDESPEKLTLGELAQKMYREPQGISALISRMEAEGLVVKKRHLKRGNQIIVSMTKKGEEVCRRQLAEGAARSVTRALSDRELDTLHAICNKMRLEAIKLIQEMRPTPYAALID